MKYNLYGRTGLYVSELCFGTMTFGGTGGIYQAIGNQGRDEARTLVKAAFDAGINFFDTANVYSTGESEVLLGQALANLALPRDQVVIASKVRGRMGSGPNQAGLSRVHVFASVEASLKRLQLDHLDILYVHGADVVTPVEEVAHTLHDLVVSGRVRHVAVCNWPAWQVMQALGIAQARGWHTFTGLQYHYALTARDIERDVVPLAQSQNLAVLPWSPLAGGFLSGKVTRETEAATGTRRQTFDFPPVDRARVFDIIDVLNAIGAARGVTAAQVALAWVRQQPGVTSTIIGARTPDQLAQNLASAEFVLDAEESARLDTVSALAPWYPGWMVERQTADRR